MKLQLLSNQKNNHKIGKNKDQNFIIWSLNFRPHETEVDGKIVNVCPFATESCSAACVGDNGQYAMENGAAHKAQLRRTALFFADTKKFYNLLYNEIDKCRQYADKKGATAVFRLNAYSDINHGKQSKRYTGECIYRKFKDCIFYDYTKDINKAIDMFRPANYFLTYSLNEDTEKHILKSRLLFKNIECLFNTLRAQSVNVAVVFEKLPASYMGFKVIDGDETDNRFLDKKGVIVGLKFKGSKAKLLQAIAGGFCIPEHWTTKHELLNA